MSNWKKCSVSFFARLNHIIRDCSGSTIDAIRMNTSVSNLASWDHIDYYYQDPEGIQSREDADVFVVVDQTTTPITLKWVKGYALRGHFLDYGHIHCKHEHAPDFHPDAVTNQPKVPELMNTFLITVDLKLVSILENRRSISMGPLGLLVDHLGHAYCSTAAYFYEDAVGIEQMGQSIIFIEFDLSKSNILVWKRGFELREKFPTLFGGTYHHLAPVADTGNSGDVLVLSGGAVGWKITDLDDDTRACQAESDRIGELIRKRKGIRSKEEIKAVVSFREWLHGSSGWFDDPFAKPAQEKQETEPSCIDVQNDAVLNELCSVIRDACGQYHRKFSIRLAFHKDKGEIDSGFSLYGWYTSEGRRVADESSLIMDYDNGTINFHKGYQYESAVRQALKSLNVSYNASYFRTDLMWLRTS